ncbi:esterase-like activity of phytase family protein [uncultured Parasphingorhabdus sp.]|uniref:esterase-like activity of phytase family protein n=1 Tax=uncultured Parasphingorhabdus sp. TaxID=2709694 RepID=UPI0030DA97C9|tara:strand:- start:182 stop:1267 length:1086 start_codon:yes stop_codon:yes gene_type:complete
MRGIMFRVLACLSLFFFLVPVTYVRGPVPRANESQYIALEPIVIDAKNPVRTRIGRLEFLGGWKITSDNAAFGGISSMIALPDSRFLMLSDNGSLFGFTLDESKHRAIRPFIAPLPDGPAKPNEFARQNWDAESFLHDPETGQFWVGYEHQHSIWRYGPSLARREAAHFPEATKNWPENEGPEAMLHLPDGRFLVFSEAAEYSKGGYQALIFASDPAEPGSKAVRFGYQPPKGYNLTDAAILDEKTALMLHRRFTPFDGVSAILSTAQLKDFQPGKIATSVPIATLRPPLKVDNMEALAVTRDRDQIFVWIASDDNFSALQESLLFKFRLLKGKVAQTKPEPERKNEKAGASPGFSTFESD